MASAKAKRRTKTPSKGDRPLRVAVARWEHIPGERLENYWRRVRDSGLEVLDVTTSSLDFDAVHGLLLTGGTDVDPALYGEEPVPHVDEVNRDRDEFELALLHKALERDMPVFAICRGHQLLNVAFGGSLLQHIEDETHTDDDGVSAHHDVTILSGTKLHCIYPVDRMHVNSRHHQAVTPDRVATDLTVSALTDDGYVEGLESNAHTWVVSVQWHPERPDVHIPDFDEQGRKLFDAFADAARRYAGLET